MIIVEDVLTPLSFRFLKSVLNDDNFPWAHVRDISGVSLMDKYADQYEDASKLKWGFAHSFVKFSSGVTDVVGWPTVVSILDEALFKAGMDWSNCYSARAFMSFPQDNTADPRQISHVDMDQEHWVLLYYVTGHEDDPTAATTFYDDDMNVIGRVIPKANSCVIFDGSTRHAGGICTKGERKIVNFNFERKEPDYVTSSD